ncbi:MAG: undecaprenyldiphospho-muramoylpentapeptide beta-N-acetylglucosaminyltransferase [Xanthomonadales bacterium]|nr:undecaprenyldiphospho-muramoylpentapeptide beta-N-acetylglucosaminyltransferase [Xanthomonadales bacterium]
MTIKQQRVMIMAGGTGGHIFPGLAVADELRSKGVDVAWLGTQAGLESRLVPAQGYPLHTIKIQGLRGKGLKGWLLAPWKIIQALRQANAIVKKFGPCVVLSMGGYVAGPGGLAARLRGIPLLIHEQNRVPGMTNKILARWAKIKFQGFPDSFPASNSVITVGNPVRESILSIEAPSQRMSQRSGPLRLLVLGGSQGAAALNRMLPTALARLPVDTQLLVRHQAGKGHAGPTRERYQAEELSADVSEFIEDMAAAYAWADLVICRAGALTVAEIAAAGLAAVFIPFPAAVDDHQTRNAEYLASAGAARILQEANLKAEDLAKVLTSLTSSRVKLIQMAEVARSLALPDAAKIVASRCQEMCA